MAKRKADFVGAAVSKEFDGELFNGIPDFVTRTSLAQMSMAHATPNDTQHLVNTAFLGTVTSHEDGLWHVRYDDEDEEDLDQFELEAVLVSEKAKKGDEGGRALPLHMPPPTPALHASETNPVRRHRAVRRNGKRGPKGSVFDTDDEARTRSR